MAGRRTSKVGEGVRGSVLVTLLALAVCAVAFGLAAVMVTVMT